MNDRLYRSRDERILAGVAGGVAERFDLDPSLVRIVWVILAIVTGGAFFWLYVVMAIVVPEAPSATDPWAGWTAAAAPGAVSGWTAPRSTGAATTAATTAAFSAAGPPDAASSEPAAEPPIDADASALSDVAMPGEPAPAAATPAEAGTVAGVSPPPDAAPSAAPPLAGAWSTTPPPQWGAEPYGRHRRRRGGSGGVIGGIVLILLGGYFLVATLAPQFDLGAFWPVLLVVIGAALVIGSFRPGRDGDGTG